MTFSGPGGPAGASVFEGRWVLVSGASSGIGRATCEVLASQGAQLVLIGRDELRLRETADRLPAGAVTRLCPLDLTRLGTIAPAVQDLARTLGKLYGLVHAAGVLQLLPLAATKPERLQALMNLNLIAGMELARALVRRDVLADSGGSIVWLSSVGAHVGQPGQIGYCATKGAIKAAVRAMALELADRPVRVNAVSPGVVETAMTAQAAASVGPQAWQRLLDMHPLGPGQPEDVARAVAFLLDPRNRWMTGTDLVIDGGYTLH
jgi:NAD(P)-dependent dehydrogenase (short-subunit alcohol dehydrogenase family)